MRTPWLRRRWVWAALIVVMLAGFAMVAGPRLKRAYDRRSATSAVRRAAEALAKGDIQHAMLEARIAYNLNSQDV